MQQRVNIDDHGSGAEERAGGLNRVVVERRVELVRRQDRHRRPARDHALQLPPVGDAAAPLFDQLLEGAQLELVVARPGDVSRE